MKKKQQPGLKRAKKELKRKKRKRASAARSGK